METGCSTRNVVRRISKQHGKPKPEASGHVCSSWEVVVSKARHETLRNTILSQEDGEMSVV